MEYHKGETCPYTEKTGRKPTRMMHCRVLVEIGRWGEFPLQGVVFTSGGKGG